MKVYISAHDIAEAQQLAERLKSAGHEITSTWHAVNGEKVGLSEILIWKQRANKNFLQIKDSEALVIIGGSDRYPGGKYVEAGYALGSGIAVFNLGPVGNGMMNFTKIVPDVESLLNLL